MNTCVQVQVDLIVSKMTTTLEIETNGDEEYRDALEYYEKHNLLDVAKSRMMFRFVRLNPRFDRKETLVMLKNEINVDPYPIQVPWMESHDFHALPSDFSLRQSECYQQRRIYGQDVSSGAAVSALLTSHHDQMDTRSSDKELEKSKPLRVLDMCCCPGLKLCMMADILRNRNNPDDVIWGVDNSQDRMSLCKRIVRQYQISDPNKDSVRIRLFCNDGTKFGFQPLNLIFDSVAAIEEHSSRLGNKRKRINKSAKAREAKRLKQLASLDTMPDSNDVETYNKALFDLVLVDAECSTDGSIVHVQQRMSQQEKEDGKQEQIRIPMLTDKTKLADLVNLQRRLALSCYRLLKPGGFMVYSTCSLSKDQNEDVIQWLLEQELCRKAKIIPVKFDSVDENLVKEGKVAGTIRFIPNVSRNGHVDFAALHGGGFFLAKIQKMP